MVSAREHTSDVRAALRVIVCEYGPEALSVPAMMSSLLADLLPDSPRIAKLLTAAAQDHVAEVLRGHVSHGMDSATAARLAASSFAAATPFPPETCAWVASEFVIALGLTTGAAQSPDNALAPRETATADEPTQQPRPRVTPQRVLARSRPTRPRISAGPRLARSLAAVILILALVAGGYAALHHSSAVHHGKNAEGPRGNGCMAGYVRRNAVPGDQVCVTPIDEAQVRDENSHASARVNPSGGPYGPDTCLEGYVWRLATPTDHVCVTPATRSATAIENAHPHRAG